LNHLDFVSPEIVQKPNTEEKKKRTVSGKQRFLIQKAAGTSILPPSRKLVVLDFPIAVLIQHLEGTKSRCMNTSSMRACCVKAIKCSSDLEGSDDLLRFQRRTEVLTQDREFIFSHSTSQG
jgi:hypothetical protein